MTLRANIHPEDATVKDIIWTSSDESVAAVDEYGLIVQKGLGTARITAKSKDGGYTASCDVEVKNFYSFGIYGPNGTSISNIPEGATPDGTLVNLTLLPAEG